MFNDIRKLKNKVKKESYLMGSKTHANLIYVLNEECVFLKNNYQNINDVVIDLLLIEGLDIISLCSYKANDRFNRNAFDQTIMQSESAKIVIKAIESLYEYINSIRELKTALSKELKYCIETSLEEYILLR